MNFPGELQANEPMGIKNVNTDSQDESNAINTGTLFHTVSTITNTIISPIAVLLHDYSFLSLFPETFPAPHGHEWQMSQSYCGPAQEEEMSMCDVS